MHFCSFLYFLYYILDNLDGKQARKTNSSSELGMIMDHSCDALTTAIFSIGLATIAGVQTPQVYFIVWTMCSIPFYFSTLEAYYVGTLHLGYLNGASEGTIIGVILMCSNGIYGK